MLKLKKLFKIYKYEKNNYLTTNMIEVNNLVKKYGSHTALKEVNFSINKGEIVGLLGPNGAGKTTAMRIITGFLKPTAGQVKVGDFDVTTDLIPAQNMIGYLPESASLYVGLSVYEQLEFAAEIHGLTGKDKKRAIQKVIKSCGLKEKTFQDISELSKGYKQRVALACALIHDPHVLILDEPTTGLDPNQIIEIRELIASLSKEKTIILSTHIMQEVEVICDRVILIKDGHLVADGSLADIKRGQASAYQILVTIKGDADDIISTIKKIPGAGNIKKEASKQHGIHLFIIESDTDLRSEINKAVIGRGFDLLEITFKENSMEDIFHELTK